MVVITFKLQKSVILFLLRDKDNMTHVHTFPKLLYSRKDDVASSVFKSNPEMTLVQPVDHLKKSAPTAIIDIRH